MQKTLTTAEVRQIGAQLVMNWEAGKNDIKLTGRALYNLIALKKILENKLGVIEETLATIALQHGGQQQEDGSIMIPAETRAEANKALIEMGQETIEIDYNEIVIDDATMLPIPIFEAIFDFVRFND